MWRFGAVGASGAVVNLVVLALLVELAQTPKWLAALAAIEASVISNYLANRAWTWRDRDRSWWSFLSYHSVTLAGVATQFAVFVLGSGRFGLHYVAASVLGIAAGTLLNFWGNDRLTFRHAGEAGRQAARRTARYAASLLVMLAIAALLRHPWDSFVFEQTVRDLVLHARTPYMTAEAMPLHAYHGWSLPAQDQWFAYPPAALAAITLTAGPAVLAGASDPVLRVALKLPAILGVLACAALVHKLILARPGGTRAAAARAERWILLNPLTWLVAGVWGQFEPLVVAGLLAAVLASGRRQWHLAGLAFAFAVLVKPYALYLAPLLLIHAWRTGGAPAARRSLAWGAGAALLVCLPFVLTAPGGFWHLVAGMHESRPPARFALLAALHGALRPIFAWVGLSTDAGLNIMGGLSLVATATVLSLLAFAAARRPADEGQLVRWMALSFTAALLTQKVVNEQYALVPLFLWTAWAHHPADPAQPRGRAILWALSAGMATAALVDSFHAVAFIPDDLARAWFGHGTLELVQLAASSLGMSLLVAFRVTRVVAVAALLPVVYLMVMALRVPLRDGVRATGQLLAARRIGRPHAGIAAMAVLLLVPVAWVGLEGADARATPETQHPAMEVSDPAGPLVVALVRTDLSHIEHWPDRPSGDWVGLPRPADGYYTADTAKAQLDTRRLQDAGVDGVILVADDLHVKNARAWMLVLEEAGLPYALAVDARDLPTGADPAAWLDSQSLPKLPRWYLRTHTLQEKPSWTLPTYVIASTGTPLEGAGAAVHLDLALHTSQGGLRVLGASTPVEAVLQEDPWAVVVPWNDFAGYGAAEPVAGAPTSVALGLPVLTGEAPIPVATVPLAAEVPIEAPPAPFRTA